ncbi:MAG: carbohydrate porin [Acidithiobacillus sp.]|nr:carbohydrate porin [Acidithiobacillus sp.]
MRCLYSWLVVAFFLMATWPFAYADEPVTTQSFWAGLSTKAKFQGEVVSDLAGGLASGSVGNALFIGGVSWDSAGAGEWHGGKVVVNFLAVDTGNPETYVGDIQGVSNLTTVHSLVRLYRLYFQQQWNPLTVRLGLLNANDYFDNAGVACDLLNASFGIVPILSENLQGMPTYPFSSLGTMVALGGGDTTLQAGVFGADAIHPWQQPFSQGALMMLELDQSGALDGGRYTFKMGFLRNRQKESLSAKLGPNMSGFYGIGEYRWQTGPLHWGAFLQGGGAPKPINPVPWYIGGGLRLAGLIPCSAKDSLSVGFSRASLRGLPHAETSYELTGIFGVMHGIHLQPDVQVIVHPGGYLPTALVGIMRLEVNFADLFGI